MKLQVLSGLFAVATIAAVAPTAEAKVSVVSGAKAVSAVEKTDVTGRCGCPPTHAPLPSKPGYGFGTTGHYGPPGQGFTPSDNWRNHAAGDGLTPTGRALPPRAFK